VIIFVKVNIMNNSFNMGLNTSFNIRINNSFYKDIEPMDTTEDDIFEIEDPIEIIYRNLAKNTTYIPPHILNSYRICDLANKSLFNDQFCILGMDPHSSSKLVQKFRDPLFLIINYLKLEYDKTTSARFEFETFMSNYVTDRQILIRIYKLSKFIKRMI